ncbi:glycosyltransferase [Candidatus Dependentiae bacterium]|nr:glycosyltransferase [Candidatus Dependentiae bacterium]
MYKKFYDRASIVLIGFVIFYSVCLMKAKLSVADSVTRYQDENEEIVNLLSVNGAKAIKDQQQAAKGNNQIYKKRQRKSIGVEKNNEVSKTKKAKYQAQKQENNQHSIEKKMKNFFHENGSDEKIIDESIYEIPRDTENKQEISNDAVKNVLLEEFITLFELQKEKPFSLSKAGELVVVIMIKNEAKVIEQTLQPYVDGGVTRLVILDTGSTDETIEKVQQFFLKNPQVEAYLFEQPFVNFEVSRNHALKCAQETFKDDCFLFMPDAEWYMQNVSGLRDFCYDHIHNSSGISYSVKIKDKTDNLNFYTQRLFKAHKGVFFQGVVHEAINIAPMMRVPEDIYILWNPSADGCDKSYIRWQRDRDLLLKELEKNPHDTRNTFYLAQTYDCLNDLENAILWYKKSNFVLS